MHSSHPPVDAAEPIKYVGGMKQLTRAMARLLAANLGSSKANVQTIRVNVCLPCEAGG
jgi:hypothetical protein